MKFKCVDECAECCIDRRYYPEIRFGKIGVILLGDEKIKIEHLAREHGIDVNILPRIGISDDIDKTPETLAYQLMGKDKDGDLCPFLDKDKRSPHGGFACTIYNDRPLACRAYPLIESDPIELDRECKFCKECGVPDRDLDSEIESLLKIKSAMHTHALYIWRFATGIGEDKHRDHFEHGWILDTRD